MNATASAYELLELARAGAYTLPEGFGGFSADLELYLGGSWHRGRVVARTPGDIELYLAVGGAEPLVEDLFEWPRRELASMLAHRSPRPFAQGEGRYPMRLTAEGPLGTRLELEDPLRSALWVQEGRVRLVERHFPASFFRIHLHAYAEAGAKYLPAHFTVIHRRADGSLEAVESFADAYTEVAGVWLPERRQVVRHDEQGLSVRELCLSHHRLLG
ncbi:conserved hypothetical protein [Allomeiothermus silvanus DSM 9946]|uniref:Uncharacterized protein n=1 Tax=Allomeiothermus silvanus (strain ATCC 700542 / DSM 9946 / NBRC 106475 / NCIMB 13440 / VI-R2) TaxID=526227 RepID=D7BHU8_ALLS1|nr:DUF3386 family protein [Allomeiothermus silvanus]ADH64038.1 conserved hypothetical protein [Allomeiothermus silvanus DSM 9946]